MSLSNPKVAEHDLLRRRCHRITKSACELPCIREDGDSVKRGGTVTTASRGTLVNANARCVRETIRPPRRCQSRISFQTECAMEMPRFALDGSKSSIGVDRALTETRQVPASEQCPHLTCIATRSDSRE